MKIIESSADKLIFYESRKIFPIFFGVFFLAIAVVILLGNIFPKIFPDGFKIQQGAGGVIGIIIFSLFGLIGLLGGLSTLKVSINKKEQNLTVITKGILGARSKPVSFKEIDRVEFRTVYTRRTSSKNSNKSYTRTSKTYYLLLILKDETEVYITRAANVAWRLTDLGKKVADFINIPFVGAPNNV